MISSKKCTKCLEIKHFSEFKRNKRIKSGLTSRCRVCLHAYENDRLRKDKKCKARLNSKKSNVEARWRYQQKNRAKLNAIKAKYRAAKLRAVPTWLSTECMENIEIIYLEARRRSEVDSINYSVDHIVPLQGENVCGLHVPWNLQIITSSENSKKRNKFLMQE